MRPVNPERGEVELVVRGEKAVLCAEMARIAALSKAIGTTNLATVYERLVGIEPAAMFAAVDCLVIDGNPEKIKRNMLTPKDLAAVSRAALESFSAIVAQDDEPGNASGATG